MLPTTDIVYITPRGRIGVLCSSEGDIQLGGCLGPFSAETAQTKAPARSKSDRIDGRGVLDSLAAPYAQDPDVLWVASINSRSSHSSIRRRAGHQIWKSKRERRSRLRRPWL